MTFIYIMNRPMKIEKLKKRIYLKENVINKK